VGDHTAPTRRPHTVVDVASLSIASAARAATRDLRQNSPATPPPRRARTTSRSPPVLLRGGGLQRLRSLQGRATGELVSRGRRGPREIQSLCSPAHDPPATACAASPIGGWKIRQTPTTPPAQPRRAPRQTRYLGRRASAPQRSTAAAGQARVTPAGVTSGMLARPTAGLQRTTRLRWIRTRHAAEHPRAGGDRRPGRAPDGWNSSVIALAPIRTTIPPRCHRISDPLAS
jgi:hypothetical protein